MSYVLLSRKTKKSSKMKKPALFSFLETHFSSFLLCKGGKGGTKAEFFLFFLFLVEIKAKIRRKNRKMNDVQALTCLPLPFPLVSFIVLIQFVFFFPPDRLHFIIFSSLYDALHVLIGIIFLSLK